MATIWHNIQPMDTVGEYLTRYEVSQRAWQIIREELLKPQWWNFAIRRFATELFNEDADHAEAVFQQGLQNHYQSASDVDSANNYSFSSDHDSGYSSDRFSDHSSDRPADQSANECFQKLCRRSGSDISLPVTQFPNIFLPFKQAWRMIPGPPSLCVPFNPTSSPLGRLMRGTKETGGAPASPQQADIRH
jgi:hypothetical protein